MGEETGSRPPGSRLGPDSPAYRIRRPLGAKGPEPNGTKLLQWSVAGVGPQVTRKPILLCGPNANLCSMHASPKAASPLRDSEFPGLRRRRREAGGSRQHLRSSGGVRIAPDPPPLPHEIKKKHVF